MERLRKAMKKSIARILILALALAMMPLMPVRATDTIHYKYVYMNDETPTLSSDFGSISAMEEDVSNNSRVAAAIVIYSEDSQTCQLTYSTGLPLIISNVAVTVAEGGLTAGDITTTNGAKIRSMGGLLEIGNEKYISSDDSAFFQVQSGYVDFTFGTGANVITNDSTYGNIATACAAANGIGVSVYGTVIQRGNNIVEGGSSLYVDNESGSLLGSNNTDRIQFHNSSYSGKGIFYYQDGANYLPFSGDVSGQDFDWNSDQSKWVQHVESGDPGNPGDPGDPGDPDDVGALEGMDSDVSGNFVINSDVNITDNNDRFSMGGGKTITINAGKSLTIGDGVECNFSGTSIAVNGNLIINGSLEVWGASLTVGGAGTVTGDSDGVLRVCGDNENVPAFSGMTLYDTNGSDPVQSNNNFGNYSYNGATSKWVRQSNGGGEPGPGPDPGPQTAELALQSNANGTVTATATSTGDEDPISVSNNATGDIPNGWDVTITFTPNTGYQLTDLIVEDGATEEDGSLRQMHLDSTPSLQENFTYDSQYAGGTLKLDNINHGYNIRAVYGHVAYVEFTVSSGNNGSINYSLSRGYNEQAWNYSREGDDRTIAAGTNSVIRVPSGDNLELQLNPASNAYEINAIYVDGAFRPFSINTEYENYSSEEHTYRFIGVSGTTHNFTTSFIAAGTATTSNYMAAVEEIGHFGFAIQASSFNGLADNTARLEKAKTELNTQIKSLTRVNQSVKNAMAANLFTVTLPNTMSVSSGDIGHYVLTFTDGTTFESDFAIVENSNDFAVHYKSSNGSINSAIVYHEADFPDGKYDITTPRLTDGFMDWFKVGGLTAEGGQTTSTDKANLIHCYGRGTQILGYFGRLQFHIGNIVTFFENDYVGVRFGGLAQQAGAWKFNNVSDKLTDNATTTFKADMFYTNNSITLSAPETSNITGIASVTCSEGATVVANGGGTYTVNFGSIYYDQVTVTITFNVAGGTTQTKQMVIKRAGICKNDLRRTGDYDPVSGVGLFPHTTTGYERIHYSDGENRRVYATFYTGNVLNANVPYGMFAKYTYADGSTSTRVITDHLYGSENEMGIQYFASYQLWSDLEARRPVYVDVTVLKEDPTAPGATAFGGVGYGSNAGERIYIPE